MKKHLFTLCCGLLIAGSAVAQTQLPNANLEDWEVASNGKDSLTGWSSSNAVAMGIVIPMKQDEDAYQGSYAAKLISAPFGIVGYTKVSILVNGEATFNWTGGSDGYHVEYVSGGGTPISIKPTELKGYYKSTYNARVDVLLTKYNTSTQQRDTVSYVSETLGGTTNYSEFTVSLPDLMPDETPDTITTFFYSTNPEPTPPNGVFSDLYLDSLTLTAPPAVPAPVADFSASPLTGTIDSTFQFTDNSSGTPTTWEWTFTPNTLTFLNGTDNASQNPTVQFSNPGLYTVKLVVSNVTGSDSLTKTDYIEIADANVGVHEINKPQQRIFYPNPAKGKLYFTSDWEDGKVQISDCFGRTVIIQQQVTTNGLDIAALSEGIYYVQVSKREQSVRQKLVILQ